MASGSDQVEHGCMQQRLDLFDFSQSCGAGHGENTGTDHGADPQERKAPRPERLPQLPLRLLGRRDQIVDALGAEEGRHNGSAVYRLRWPLTIFFTLRFCEPRSTSLARFAFGAAFLRAARFSFLRSSLSSIFLVFIQSLFLQISQSVSSTRRTESSRLFSCPRPILRRAARCRGHIWRARSPSLRQIFLLLS